MRPEHRVEERLAGLKRAGLYRDPALVLGEAGVVERGLIDARSNDYLGLAQQVVSRETGEARNSTSLAAAGHTGEVVSRETPGGVRVGAGAARLISGTTAEHLELESALASWLETEACLLFSSAYAANLGAISALGLEGDTIFSDTLNHASIIDGCRLSRARVVVLPHRDLGALEAALRAHRSAEGSLWVVTETYFGMDGTSPDLAGLRTLCDAHEAALVLDEAHALGVFGEEGRGLAALAGVRADVVVGGLGKAFGLHGGFVASSRTVQRWLWNRARSFVFSTAPSPWLCERGLEHLRRVRRAETARRHLAGLGERLELALSAAGVALPTGRHGPLFPILFGAESAALDAAAALLPLGVLCQPIRPPTVPKGTARVRVTLRADMTAGQVDLLARALVRVWTGRRKLAPVEATVSRNSEAARPAPVTTEGSNAERTPTGGDADAGWVVLGTGTGVGKTFVALELVRAIAEAGRPVAGLKPIETGCRTSPEGQPHGGDAALLEAASFHVKHPRPHPLYGLQAPLTPSLAARREGVAIQTEAVASWVDRVRSTTPRSACLVVETAGGVFSPLTETLTNFDLALCLGSVRWMLVAPDRLGVLHEVMSTLRAMRSLGRAPDCLLLNAPAQPDESTGTNAPELRRLGVGIPILVTGRGDGSSLSALFGTESPVS